MDITITPEQLFYLLQFASPSLPVGAYCYSDGLETLVSDGVIDDASKLENYLRVELKHGAIRIDVGVMVRGYMALKEGNYQKFQYWNEWLSATRESVEIRNSSWQMGRSLLKLLGELEAKKVGLPDIELPCNYAIAFAVASHLWQIPLSAAVLAYLHAWLSNLITAGIKLIPLGQTAGQQILVNLQPTLTQVSQEIITSHDDDLAACSWGFALASMQHETLYTRLFRS